MLTTFCISLIITEEEVDEEDEEDDSDDDGECIYRVSSIISGTISKSRSHTFIWYLFLS